MRSILRPTWYLLPILIKNTFAPNEYLEQGSFSVLNLRSTELASGRTTITGILH